MRLDLRLAPVLLATMLLGCGDGDSPPPAPLASGTSGAVTSLTSPMGGMTEGMDGSGSADSGSDSGGVGDTGVTDPPTDPAALPTLGSVVFLGDSTSSMGGDPPFYYDLLLADLDAYYGGGAVTLDYFNLAAEGASTASLSDQIAALPAEMTGPVAVVITVGFQDLQDALSAITTGNDVQQRIAMRTNLEGALDELLTPDRFGAGVEVTIFETNLFDPSEGEGDFTNYGCAFAQGLPPIASANYFADWNLVISDSVGERGQYLIDMATLFTGHGYASAEPWTAADCIHPNDLGHDALRRSAYEWITGEVLP